MVLSSSENTGYIRPISKGSGYYPRWWIYQQVIRVFEQSKRSVPVFNDKHLSTSWDEAKWMFDKSRELNFPLIGGSSIPFYFRKPEIELDIDTPIKASVVAGGAGDEGGLFHCVDVLQAFVERRKGGETGIEAVQCIRGPETWKWTERNPWAGKLLDAVRTSFDLKPGHFQETVREPNVCIVDYRDGTKAAVYSVRGVGWTYAGEIEGRKDPTIVSMLGWPGPYSQYHAANAFDALDYRDDADRKGTIQCGAAASVHRDCVVQHGIKLGERPLLCHRTPHRDAVHEHDLPLDSGTAHSARGRGRRTSHTYGVLKNRLCSGVWRKTHFCDGEIYHGAIAPNAEHSEGASPSSAGCENVAAANQRRHSRACARRTAGQTATYGNLRPKRSIT